MITSDARTPTLDEIGILTGTDKNLFVGDYLRHYDSIFSPFRDEEFNLIEIGVFHGNSMALWSRYFSRAHVIGIDVNPACKQYESDRVTIEIGDIENPEFVLRLTTEYSPTLVIDDGSHRADHQIFAFERFFPALKPGGIYIVEDLHFQLTEPDASRLRGEAQTSSVEYFQKIAERRLAASYQRRRFHGLDAYFSDAVDSIQFIQQAVIIRKAVKAPPLPAQLERLRPLVEESGHYRNWLQFGLLLRDLGRIQEATDSLRRAVTAKPDDIAACEWLSVLLEQQGDVDRAIAALEHLPHVLRAHPDLVQRVEKRMADLRQRI